jgi:hypothetical protein
MGWRQLVDCSTDTKLRSWYRSTANSGSCRSVQLACAVIGAVRQLGGVDGYTMVQPEPGAILGGSDGHFEQSSSTLLCAAVLVQLNSSAGDDGAVTASAPGSGYKRLPHVTMRCVSLTV